MESLAEMRKGYQPLFAWAFLLATILALAMVWAELAFPPAPMPAVAPAAAAGGEATAAMGLASRKQLPEPAGGSGHP